MLAAIVVVGALAVLRRSAPAERPRVGSPEADAQTLRALRDAGANLAKPTEVNFYLYFPTRAAAEQAAAAARTPAFRAAVGPGGGGEQWLCVVTTTMAPTQAAIRAATVRLQAVADSLGGEYDGWDAAVAR